MNLNRILPIAFASVILAISTLHVFAQSPFQRFSITGTAQGTTYSVVYYSNEKYIQKHSIDSLLNAIDSSLSIYKKFSIISRFNNGTGPIKIDAHLDQVIKMSRSIHNDTKGIFDITIGRLTDYWGFGINTPTEQANKTQLKASLSCKGMDKISIVDSFLFKADPCIKLDVNGIAQGYSVDLMAQLLLKYGLNDFIIELGGEILISGKKLTTNEPIKIAIEFPAESSYERSDSLLQLIINYGAVTTSGIYKKNVESSTKKVNHLFDARNGKSVSNNLIAVTVWAHDATSADGYDNALMVMGLKKGLKFIEKRKDLAAIFFFRSENGQIRMKASSRFAPFIVK